MKFLRNAFSKWSGVWRMNCGLRLLLLAILMALTLAPSVVRADYNLQRAGFSYSYPTNFSDWANGYFAGNGKLGIIVFCDPLNERVIYNDRGFNMAADTNSPSRSFAQVSPEDLETIRSNCAAGNFEAANRLGMAIRLPDRSWNCR